METINDVVEELCKREGKKRQVNVAQMAEIVGHLSDMFFEAFSSEDHALPTILILNGNKRAKAKKKRRKSCRRKKSRSKK